MNPGEYQSVPPDLVDQVAKKPPEARRKIEQVWSLLGRLVPDAPDVPGDDAAWRALQQRLDAIPAPAPADRPGQDRGPLPRSYRRIWGGITIMVFLVVLLIGVWWQQPVTIIVPPGAQQTIALPDGSTVDLNSDSQLQYARQFRTLPFLRAKKRAVALAGEAYFKVVRDQIPFEVETFNARVEVLGTEFNVRARRVPATQETRVTLASGHVRVRALLDGGTAMDLSEAGEEARVADAMLVQPTLPERTDDLRVTLAWRQKGFAVVDQSLPAILAEVERRFALTVALEEGLVLVEEMTLFYPRGTTAEQIINDICLAQGCHYRAVSTGFLLFEPETTSPPISNPQDQDAI